MFTLILFINFEKNIKKKCVNTMSCTLGMGSFKSIGNAFTSAKNSAGGLSGALKSLRSKIDMVSVV